MSFNQHDIRRAMDVYTMNNLYLGTVLEVILDDIGQGSIRVGKWWGLRGSQTIPLAAIQTVSLERIVLRWGNDPPFKSRA